MTNIDTDQALVATAKDDIGNFGGLYERYQDRIFRYIRFRVSSIEIAEDLTSQTFLKAIESFEKYTEKGNTFGSWLYTIAGNLIIDWYRKKKHLFLEDIKEDKYSQKPDLDEKIDKKIHEKQFVMIFNQLKETEQQILILKSFEELTFKEIADFLGKTESAVKMLYYRSLEKIKSIAKEQFSNEL